MQHIIKTEIPKNYEAFLYQVKIDNNKIKNKYIGSKKGLFDRTYYGSPITHEKEYFEDLGKFDSIMEILAFGTYQDILYMEKKMLIEVNAKSNPEWFNASNLSGHQATGYNAHLDYVRDKITNRDYPQELMAKEKVFDIDTYQVREHDEIPGKCKALLAKMNDTQGKYCFEQNKEYPVIAFEDYFGKGKHLRIDGKHMTKAAQSCKFVKDLHIMWVSKADHKLLEESDVHTLGLSLNPQLQILRDPTSESEAVTWLVSRKKNKNINIKNESNRIELKKWDFSSQKINALMTRAEEIDKKGKALLPGEYIHDYSKGTSAATLKRKVKQLSNIPNTGVIVTKSGMPKNVWKEIILHMTEIPENTIWRILVWHDSVNNRDIWQKKYSLQYKDMADHLQDNWKQDLRIDFEELPFTYFNELKNQIND